MSALLVRPHAKILLALTGVSLLLAGFFRFALIGYGTISLLLACLAGVFLLYFLLPGKLKIMLTVLVILAAAVLVTALLPVIRAAGGDKDIDADYVIVLGAGVNGASPSLSMVDRLRAAREYLEKHPDAAAILSGGQGPGEDITEAEAMFRWLTANGVGGERLILEDKATSTLENLQNSFALIPDMEAASVAVLSSEYHLYRAEYLAGTLGHRVVGVPAETSLPVLKVNYFLREALGLIYYQLFGIS